MEHNHDIDTKWKNDILARTFAMREEIQTLSKKVTSLEGRVQGLSEHQAKALQIAKSAFVVITLIAFGRMTKSRPVSHR